MTYARLMLVVVFGELHKTLGGKDLHQSQHSEAPAVMLTVSTEYTYFPGAFLTTSHISLAHLMTQTRIQCWGLITVHSVTLFFLAFP
jgi:hypothetical protein